ncbi:MAG: hypothetical protein OIN88_08905 [Candidatus Methanoperedens sp.]|nr:hypothetical protein [Candidatus Methanoperedens sp.]
MPEAKSLKDLMRIRAHNREFLESINHNLGTALGFKKRTGQPLSKQPAIIVFVPQKINPRWIPEGQMIPEKLEGPDDLWCALDVVEGGKAKTEEEVPRAEDELAEQLRGWADKVWSGSQISHWINQDKGEYSVGTLGAFAKSRTDGDMGFLTNQHVGIEHGQKIYHPVPWGTHIGTTEKVIEYVEDQEWYGQYVDEPKAFVRADCAFVKLEPNFNDINPQMMGVGELGPVKNISFDDMSIIGRRVLRVGRTTGLRRGTIVAFGYEFIDDKDATAYTDLLIIGDNNIPFSTHGDSGSLIVLDNEELNPIGLLWGGWQEKLRTGYAQENWTYGIALSRLLDALEIDLMTSL